MTMEKKLGMLNVFFFFFPADSLDPTCLCSAQVMKKNKQINFESTNLGSKVQCEAMITSLLQISH